MSIEAKAGIIMAGIIITILITGIFYTPYDPLQMNSSQRFLKPCKEHILGTDNFGRDVFSRISSGGAYSLIIAFLTIAVSAFFGTTLGLMAGYSSKKLDAVIMRIMDITSSFPGLLIALSAAAMLGNNSTSLCLALIMIFTPGFTRIMRNETLKYKQEDFILAEQLLGAGYFRIIFIHIFPNISHALLSASIMGLSGAILAESALSYLGLGVQPPIPSWGRMLAESQNFLLIAPWCSMVPGFCITLSVLAFHYLGEGLKWRYWK
jgi:peptide/nickel transport system permease protein